MEYKEVPTAEKGCPYPLNRTAATDRIELLTVSYLMNFHAHCNIVYLDKVDVCVFLLLSSFRITAPIKRSRPRMVFELRIPSLLFQSAVLRKRMRKSVVRYYLDA